MNTARFLRQQMYLVYRTYPRNPRAEDLPVGSRSSKAGALRVAARLNAAAIRRYGDDAPLYYVLRNPRYGFE